MFFLRCQISEKWKKNRRKLQEKYQNGQLGNRWRNRRFKEGKATNGKKRRRMGETRDKDEKPNKINYLTVH